MRRRSVDPATITAAAGQLFSAWDALREGGWRGPAMGARLSVGCDMLALYLLFVAARYVVDPGILLAGYGLPLLLGQVSFLPGGLELWRGRWPHYPMVWGYPKP
jgi:hypothetical protein